MAIFNKRVSGQEWEEKAAKFLESQGYKILQRNFRIGKFGEIDIIASDGEYLCFVEVKSRRTNNFGTPAEAVTQKKQITIKRLATMYTNRPEFKNKQLRFDVVEIYTSNDFRINLIKNAF